MLYSTILQRDQTGFDQIYEAARSFEEEKVLEAIIICKFDTKKLNQTLNLVRIYQLKLINESMDLVEFSQTFIEEYATDHNECFRLTERLIRRIGTTMTGSMKIFRKFCPVVRRKLDDRGNIVPTLEYSRLVFKQFSGQLFGPEVYIDIVKTLLHEMATFFYHLVTTMQVCKDMIRKEEEAMGNIDYLKRIFEKSCNEALKGVRDVFDTFGQVKIVSDEEINEHRKNARPLTEWIAKEYHAHDKKWMKREAYFHRLQSGNKYGLDETQSILWNRNPAWGCKVFETIPKLDSLNIPYKHSKKAREQGKLGTFDAREMVYFIKWSGVSYLSADGKIVIDEPKERQFYLYTQRQYKGNYLLPSWQAVCRERKFLYEEHIPMQEMADKFAEHLNQQEVVA